MPYIAGNPRKFVDESVGNGQCVAYARAAAQMPHTAAWQRGTLVKGNLDLQPGTAIATFDDNGHYGNHTDGRSHVAIYLGQDASGIRVLDQWVAHKRDQAGHKITVPQPVHERIILFRKAPRVENNGDNYYVVE
ncbi:hypothetical protein SAMN02745857_03856 [Andreprevotia lacus DSM 23236]|uniref:NlpC/P60 family protein n=1 Tax=Andreprevotia lacus DSM 23236 TaxID=1121001 RepID=A0A1W1Y128_9NEIS|nr:BPSL0067 family protein [Andreprevotia lacus]SMC29468.1 hypothetical protein SAMN02745857_03856 [Andreprevotia lacus DSM 23236]